MKDHLRSITVLSLLMLSVIRTAHGQPVGRDIADQFINWTMWVSNIKLSERSTLFLDGQLRRVASPGKTTILEPMQELLRGHIEFRVRGKLTFAPFGYARIFNHLYGKQPAGFINQEHRLYQQLAYTHISGRISVNHRLRTEERFIQDHDVNGKNLGYSNRQFRARYRIMANLPIGKMKLEPKTFFASAFYEGFISSGEKVTFHDVDQNRIYMGAGYQFSRGVSLNAGYQYQMLVKSNGAKQENNAGLLVMVTTNLDLTRKEN